MGRNHLRHLSAREGCALAAVADPDPQLVADAVAKTGTVGFADALAMINDAPLDAVVIAAPTTAHASLVSAAIERGLPVLVEKPLASTVADGIELVAAARTRGIPLQVGHVERFNPAVLELGRRLAKGWIGTLYSITSRRAGPFPARIRDVGVTIDLATHDADILSWVAGERPTRVYAETAQRQHTSNEDLLLAAALRRRGRMLMSTG
jgi:predicted dehydrogenase